MRRLAITGLCAIASLSYCAGGGVAWPSTSNPSTILLPCHGTNLDTDEWHLGNAATTVVFQTDGRCQFSKAGDFSLVDAKGNDPPPNFTRHAITYPSAVVLYSYDGKNPIPSNTGYKFTYHDDYPKDGNGSGIVKN